jgi:hypothetical protein
LKELNFRKKPLAFYLAATGLIMVYLLILQAAANLNKPVFYGLVAALALFVVIVTARKPQNVLDFFRSLKLAASVLVYFTIAVIIGTLILQNVEPARYLQSYSPGFYKFVKLLTLEDTYHSVWFTGLVLLLNLNILICTLNHLPIKKKKIGFFLIHLSILVVVIGGSISAFFGVKGYLNLHEGDVVSEFQLTQYNQLLDQKRNMGFQLRLDKFEVDHYDPDYRVYVYTRPDSKDKFGMPHSLKTTENAEYPIKKAHGTLKILKFFPDYAVREVAKPADTGPAAVKVMLHKGEHSQEAFFFDTAGDDRFLLPNQQGMIVFKWDMPKNPSAAVSEQKLLTATFPDGTHRLIPVQEGKTYPFTADSTVKIGRFIPSFSIDQKSKQIVSAGSSPDNPAIELIFSDKKTGKTTTQWAFANFPDFTHGKTLPGNATIRFTFVPTLKGKPIYIISANGRYEKTENGKTFEKGKLENNRLTVGNLIFEFSDFMPHAEKSKEELNRSDNPNNPVARIQWIQNGQKETRDLAASDKTATFMDNGRVALLLRNKDDTPKAYRSYVSVLKDGKVVLKKKVQVNSPLAYGGYYFYQSNYNPKDPTYSGISVVRDPGVYIVFLGFLLLTIGGILRFYFKM